MKKIATGIITVICAICFFYSSTASAGIAVNTLGSDYQFIQDTNPRPQRDSTKWNKKKHKDSTGKSKTDTLRVRN